MSIKLDTLADWNPLVNSIGLHGEDKRRVKIYFNAEAVTPLYIKLDGESPRFLTTLPYGLSTLEFWAEGTLEIAPADADAVLYWQSTEDEAQVFEGDGESFTTIHERQPRNEALEWMQYQSQLNQQRMEAALRSQMDQQLAALKEAYEGKAGIHGVAPPEHPEPEKSAVKLADKASEGPAPGASLAPDGTPKGDQPK